MVGAANHLLDLYAVAFKVLRKNISEKKQEEEKAVDEEGVRAWRMRRRKE